MTDFDLSAGWSRRALWGGVVGPIGFVAAWIVGGLQADGYSPVDDAISRLAAVDAETRVVMTIGFLCFGIGVPLFAWGARSYVGAAAAMAFAASGIMTLAVAATPLDRSDTIDGLHGLCATLGYVALAAGPVLARSHVRACGCARLAALAPLVSVVAALSLAATALGPASGLFQRVGLTVVDAWIVAAAVTFTRRAPAIAVGL